MKRVALVIIFLTSLSLSFAQSGKGFGVKAGLNYNANGDYFNSISTVSDSPDANIGFHIGVFAKLGNALYFKPELVYTNTKSDYNSGDFNMQKLDVPLLVGYKVIGPIHVFGGPALQYILDTGFDQAKVERLENDFSVGLNFGIGLSISKVGIDLRYERGFSNNEAAIITNNTPLNLDRLATRPSQLILSVSYML